MTRLAGPDQLPQALQQPLVLALAVNLGHQHSRVRLASLQALDALVQHGTPLALLQEHVLPAVLPLAHDHAPAIRATLFSAAAQWAGSDVAAEDAADEGRALNQCRAALPSLLPLLLLGLTDEVEAIRSRTYAQLENIGARMASAVSFQLCACEATCMEACSCSHGFSLAFPQAVPDDPAAWHPSQVPGYCHPFSSSRPSAATRSVVQSQLSRLLQHSLKELKEWTGAPMIMLLCFCCVQSLRLQLPSRCF